jgi:hypothetical protein
MADPVPTIEPTQFRLGDSLQWDKVLEDYSPADWQLKYRLLPQSSGTALSIVAGESGNTFQVRVTSDTTEAAPYAAGDFWMLGWVEDGTDRFQIYAGPMTVLADPAQGHQLRRPNLTSSGFSTSLKLHRANEAPLNVIR